MSEKKAKYQTGTLTINVPSDNSPLRYECQFRRPTAKSQSGAAILSIKDEVRQMVISFRPEKINESRILVGRDANNVDVVVRMAEIEQDVFVGEWAERNLELSLFWLELDPLENT